MIYADHAATAPLCPEAREAMRPFMEMEFGNPSTLYSAARAPRDAVRRARESIANVIGAKPEEIFFTSGGTESDNWALMGTALRYIGQRKRIITSVIEHHAVLRCCEYLSRLGFDIVALPVDRRGIVSEAQLRRAVDPNTVLVSIMLANNEIGTIQPIERFTLVTRDHNIPFHTDAVQMIGHMPVNVDRLGVDMLSASAHKFGGPKGVGFLYVREGTQLDPLIHGGGQESGMRAGTENVAGIVGMAAALEARTRTMASDAEHMEQLRKVLIERLRAAKIDFLVNGAEEHVPGSLSLSFRLGSGEAMLQRLDLMGVAVATGSACNSKASGLSHVIRAIDVHPSYADGTIRVTLGHENTREETDRIADAIIRVIGI